MFNESQITSTLDKLEEQVPGFIAASLVDVESGMTLGATSADPNFDLTMASAFNSEMVKQKLRIIETLGYRGSLEDIIVDLSDQIHLIKVLNPGTFLYLVVSRRTSNLAIARSMATKHAQQLTD
jgi:predicted regulator of Ras-like GTPase activity (Roadblock/LC7/MglB family)